ncbi:MAG: hypothetical protein EBV30_03340 [Actinobacteria bacterium]|nr:hypothetical protein [Actinomycetota bacterium]
MVLTPGDGQIAITWQAPVVDSSTASITGYDIDRSTDGSTWAIVARNVAAGGTLAATISPLTNGVRYYIRVTTVSALGSVGNAVKSATPATLPNAAESLTATTVSSTRIDLAWMAPLNTGGAEILGYTININDGSGWAPALNGARVVSSPASITGLTPGTSYAFHIHAVNSVGESAQSNEASALTFINATVPQNFRARGGGSGTVILTWDPPVSTNGLAVTSYTVQYSFDGGSWTVGSVSGSTLTKTLTGLVDGHTYFFRVQAITASGNGAVAATIGIPATVADAPTNLTAVVSGDRRVSITWTAPTNTGGTPVTDYQIETSIDSGVTWTVFNKGGAITSPSFVLTALSGGVDYQIRVSAITSAGTGSASLPAMATVLALPAAPTGVVVTSQNLSLKLDWSAPSGLVTSYRVEYSENGSTWTTATTSAGLNATTSAITYTITGLVNSRLYFVRVTGTNAAGMGTGAVTSGIPATTPSAPTSLTASGIINQVLLSWIAPPATAIGTGGAPITGYKIEVNDGSGWKTSIANTGSSSTSAPISTVDGTVILSPTASPSYQFRVSAINSAGAGTASNIVTSLPIAQPGAVASLSATPSSGQVILNWSASTGSLVGYVVERSTNGTTWTTASTTSPSTLSYTATGLTNSTTYYFRVSALSNVGAGTPAVISSMPVSTPGTPTSFAAAVVGSTVKLTWVAPVSNGGAAITSYLVESSSNGTTWSATSTQPSGTATSVSLTGISGTLSYRVKAVNSQGNGPASSVVTAQALSAPSPVGVLTLIPLDSALRVDWSDSSTTTTSYRVEWALASNASLWTAVSPSVPKPVSGSAVTTTISGLTNGIAYMVRVSGENSAGIGASSIGAGTPRAPAAAPANFQVLNDNGDAVLSWTASASGGAPIVGYRIETATAGTWSVAVANTNSSATNYRVTGLAIGTTYSFRVTAITSDSYGSLVGSTSAEVSLTSVAAPTSATSITVTPKNGAVDLAWTTVADALAYRVEYSTNGVTWTNLYASTQLTSISNISGLTNGVNYFFRVTAFNDIGPGPASIASEAPRGPASKPLNIGAVADSNLGVSLSWSVPSSTGGVAIQKYRIGVTPNGGSRTTIDTSDNATNFRVSGLTNGGTYIFDVAALTAQTGELTYTLGASSDTITAVANLSTSSLVAPASLSLAIAAKTPSVAIRITWSAPVGVTPTRYLVQAGERSTTGTTTWRPVRVSKVDANSSPVGGTDWFITPTSDTSTSTPSTVLSGSVLSIDAIGLYDTSTATTSSAFVIGRSYVFRVIADTGITFDTATVRGGVSYLRAKTLKSAPLLAGPVIPVKSANLVTENSDGSVATVALTSVPDAPTAVLANNVGPSKVGVTWTSPLNTGDLPLDGYEVTIVNGGSTETATVTSNSYIYSGIAGVTYTFTVKAINAEGYSVASASASATARAVTAIIPTSVATSLGAADSGRVTLSWSVASESDVTGYTIERSENGVTWTAIGALTVASSGSAASRSFVVGNPAATGAINGNPALTSGHAYFFRVAATNSAGVGSYGSASAIPLGTPNAPVVSGVGRDGSVILLWSPPTDPKGRSITGYEVLYANGSVVSCGTSGLDTSCTVGVGQGGAAIVNGTPLTLRVRATFVDVLNIGTPGRGDSSTVIVTPVGVPDAPISGSSVATNHQLVLNWSMTGAPGFSAANAPTGYEIEQLTGGSFNTIATISNALTFTYTVGSLTNGTSYLFRIWAKNDSGRSATALLINGTPVGAPGVPGLALAVAPASVTASWTQPTDTGGRLITDYIITATQASVPVDTSACVGTSMTCIIGGLTNGIPVTVTVTAKNEDALLGTPISLTATPVALPLSVSSLDAVSPVSHSITLTWTSGVTGHRVERSLNGVTWTVLAPADTASSPITDNAVPNDGVDLFYRVSGINDAGVGPGTVITAQSKGAASAVQNIQGTQQDRAALISWDLPASTGGLSISGYKVTGEKYEASAWVALAGTQIVCGATTTSYQWTGLSNGTAYHFTVSPFAVIPGHTPGLDCSTWNVTTADFYIGTASTTGSITPSPVPGAVSGLVGTAGDGKVTLNWDPLPGAAYYVVEAKGSVGPNFATVTCANDTLTTCLVDGLIPGLTYIFRVTGINSAGAGAASLSTVALVAYVAPPTPPTPPTPSAPSGGGGTTIVYIPAPAPTVTTPVAVPVAALSAPENLIVIPGNRQLTISWSAVKDAKGYHIQVSLDSNTWKKFADLGADAKGTIVTGLTNGVTTYVRIVPFAENDGAGAVVAAAPATTPEAPAKVVVTPHDKSIDVAWQKPNDDGGSMVTAYQIEISIDGGVTWSLIRQVDDQVTATTLENLRNGASYSIRVSALNKVGKGKSGSANTSTVIAVVPSAPIKASVARGGTHELVVSWQKPTNSGGATITGYLLEQSRDGVSYTKVGALSSNATSAKISGLQNGTTYFVRLSTVTELGPGGATVVSGTPATLPGVIAKSPQQVASNDGRVFITWSAPVDAGGLSVTGYQVERAPSLKGPWAIAIANTGSGLTRAEITGLKIGVDAFVRVRAINEIGIGGTSPIITVTAITPASAPLQASIVRSGKRISLKWSAPKSDGGSDVTGYQIETSRDGRTWTVLMSAQKPPAVIKPPKSATLIRVRAVTKAGKGAPSAAFPISN